ATAQAEALFRQGRALLEARKVSEACAAFQESQRLEPAVTTLINLAGCRAKPGQLATAWGPLLDRETQARAGTSPGTHQLPQVGPERAGKLEPRVSKLVLDVPAGQEVDGLEIVHNQVAVPRGMWSRDLPVDGGTYTVVATAAGFVTWSVDVVVLPEAD